MNCEYCGASLIDKEKSNENWSVIKTECPACGKKPSSEYMVSQLMAAAKKPKKRK